jgi:hypothetical protein
MKINEVLYGVKARVLNLFASTSTAIVILFASEHRHKMSTGSYKDQTVHNHVKEHHGAHEQ